MPTPQNLLPKLGFRQNSKSIFHHEAVIFFAYLTSKMNSLTAKTPMLQFSGIRLLQIWNYSTIFKTREQNLPLVAENSNCDNLKTTRGIRKKFFYSSLFDTFSLKNKFVIYQKHGYKKFKNFELIME